MSERTKIEGEARTAHDAAHLYPAARLRPLPGDPYEQLIEGTGRLAASPRWREYRAARREAIGDAAATEALRLRLDEPDLTNVYSTLWQVATSLEYAVSLTTHELHGGRAKCEPDSRQIWLRPEGSRAQRAKVLAHELAHGVLGHCPTTDRSLHAAYEIEAEAVAYLVAGACGLDTSAYSFGYMLLWARGARGARAQLRASGPRITQATLRILRARALLAAAPEMAA